MPIQETLTASPATLAEVFSNGKRYIVPPFQRDYAWEESEWMELWTDLMELRRASKTDHHNHYLGALVLQRTAQRAEMNIIDGQQRLVTLSLLALSVIGRIEKLIKRGLSPDDNRERVRILREKFVSTKDSASLQHRSRMKLNDHDNPFYELYLVQAKEPTRPNSLKGSEQRLYRAFKFFDQAIEKQLGADADGETLARFLEETVANRIRFIEILVEDDETAFTVFETLNARGIALGTADLLKNFVFSIAAKGGANDLNMAKSWWDQILDLVPMDQLASFMFHKLAGKVADLREKRVFTEVKRLVPEKMTIFDFLRDVKDAADIYAGLDYPNSDFWAEFPDARKHVRVLDILRVEQCRPVILAAFPRLSERPERLARLLRNLVTISLRATVVRINTGDLQRVYHATAVKIENGELKSPLAITKSLADITPTDEDFKAGFAQWKLEPKGPRKRLLRYVLGELEAAVGGAVIDFEASDATIEHILPENPNGEWELFSGEDRQRDITRLGNLTPLEYSLNREIGSSNFEQKWNIYQRSRYKLTRDIVHSEWSPAAVRARQLVLAEKAVAIWRIDSDE